MSAVVKQAKITCLCKQLRLPDLQIDLKQGDSAWVSLVQARESVELQRYTKQGALRVEYLERVLPPMSNDYPAWFALARRSNKVQSVSKPIEKPLEVVTPVTTESDALLQKIESLQQVCQNQAVAIQALTTQQKALLEVVQSVLSGLGSVGSVVPAGRVQEKVSFMPEVEESAVFIPSNLVDTTQAVSVDVASGGNASQLEESAAQLRSLGRSTKTQDIK